MKLADYLYFPAMLAAAVTAPGHLWLSLLWLVPAWAYVFWYLIVREDV
jgi:hypothetical protein